MRQIGQELAPDPRKPIVTEAIGGADLSNPVNSAAYSQFTWNKFAEMSHKFCSRGLNLSSGKYGEAEQQRFQTCLGKYQESFNIFKQEQNIHFSAIQALEEAGGDRFAKLNEPDRF